MSVCTEITTPIIHEYAEHVFHLYVIRTPHREKLIKYLSKKGISTGIHYPKALPFLNAYKSLNHNYKDFPVAYEYQSQILSLPIYPEITVSQIEYVCKAIKTFFVEKYIKFESSFR